MHRDVRVIAEATAANTEAIHRLRADMEQRFEAVDQRFMLLEVRMGQKFEELELRVDQKLDALERRMDRKLDSLEERLGGEIQRITTHLGIDPPKAARRHSS